MSEFLSNGQRDTLLHFGETWNDYSKNIIMLNLFLIIFTKECCFFLGGSLTQCFLFKMHYIFPKSAICKKNGSRSRKKIASTLVL